MNAQGQSNMQQLNSQSGTIIKYQHSLPTAQIQI